MSYTDVTKSLLIINRLSQAKYNELAELNLINDDELYIITDLKDYVITDDFNSAIGDINDRIDGLGNVFSFKGSLENYDDLPTENNKVGDVYHINSTSAEYAYTQNGWEYLGVSVDLSGYATEEWVENKGYLTEDNLLTFLDLFIKNKAEVEEETVVKDSNIEISANGILIHSDSTTIVSKDNPLNLEYIGETLHLLLVSDKGAFYDGLEIAVKSEITPEINWKELDYSDRLIVNNQSENTVEIVCYASKNYSDIFVISCLPMEMWVSVKGLYNAHAEGLISDSFSIQLPKGDITIESHAFDGCSGLTAITIPDSVTSIGSYAFHGCSGLTAITIPDLVTSIRDSTFSGCSGLTAITIPDSVTSIGSYAFKGCSGLTAITIPDSVTSIRDSTFSGCSGLTAITIPDSVTSIGSYAFHGCSGLTAITIPDLVTSIGSGAFMGCSGLTAITIPDLVTSIRDSTFSGCSGLTAITIPDLVTSIGWLAFDGCRGLTAITIPDSVTSIGSGAFMGCSGLTAITIPDLVTSIESHAFHGCSGLTAITIPDLVTSIGWLAFQDCTNLTTINYTGTEKLWNAISKGTYWNSGCPHITVYCIDNTLII